MEVLPPSGRSCQWPPAVVANAAFCFFLGARNKQENIRRCASENAKNRPQARTFLDQISDWHLDWTYRFDLCLVVQWPDAGSRCDVRKVLYALTTEHVSNKE